MPLPAALLPMLDRIADPLVDRSMAAALPQADPATQDALVERLLARGDAGALEEAVAVYPGLGERARERLAGEVRRLGRAVRAIIRRADATPGLRLLADAADQATADLLGPALRHPEPEMAETAAGVLLDLALAIDDGRDEPAPRALRVLDEAISGAVADYATHRQPATLLALFARLPARLEGWEMLARPASPALEAARRLLEESRQPTACRALLPALGEPRLAAAARAGLHACLRQGRLGELLDPAVAPGALADPAVRRRLTAAEPLREVAREASAVAFEDRSLDASVATLFSLLLPAVNDDAGIDWHTHLSRPTRAAALLAACRSRTSPESPTIAPGDDPLVAVAVGDEDAGIAELAARVAMRRHGERGGELAMRWLDSPHDGVRRLAEARVSRDGFDALWERWPKLPDAARRDLATALIKVDRRLHHRLAARLDEPDDGVRCRALAIIHDLNQGVYFQDRLTQLANAPSQAVASAAIRAMGTAESPETATALGDALRHPDPRRRADAAAALAHRGIDDDTDAAVRDTTRDDHAEPRAQAIAALHRTNPDAATDALHAMLDDDRPDHRDHALRLIASAGMVEMACPVAEMSISDRDPLVRRRASETIVELLRLLEAGTQASEDRSDPSPQEAA